jgi:hypothetical protein
MTIDDDTLEKEDVVVATKSSPVGGARIVLPMAAISDPVVFGVTALHTVPTSSESVTR